MWCLLIFGEGAKNKFRGATAPRPCPGAPVATRVICVVTCSQSHAIAAEIRWWCICGYCAVRVNEWCRFCVLEVDADWLPDANLPGRRCSSCQCDGACSTWCRRRRTSDYHDADCRARLHIVWACETQASDQRSTQVPRNTGTSRRHCCLLRAGLHV